MKWYRKAAEQGFADAQYNLGVMYANGEGVPKDFVEAYAWLNISASMGLEVTRKNRDIIDNKMTTAQKRQAQERTKELMKMLEEKAAKK